MISKHLTSENCLEFLEHLGYVFALMSDIQKTERIQLFVDVARLADTTPFAELNSNQHEVFWPTAESVAVESLESMVSILDSETTAELGRAILTDCFTLTVAAKVADKSFNESESRYSRKLLISTIDKEEILALFAKNVFRAATEGHLFNTSNPGFILSRLARLAPDDAPRVFEAIKSTDSSLDAFAMAILMDTFAPFFS